MPQSVMDAIADEETLMLEACEHSPWIPVQALWSAHRQGYQAALSARAGDSVSAAYAARHAAHEAFVAVPALRGE